MNEYMNCYVIKYYSSNGETPGATSNLVAEITTHTQSPKAALMSRCSCLQREMGVSLVS